MEGGLDALPVIEPSGSCVEISVDFSTQCGFMVDLGLSVLAARWFAAVPFPRASLAPVVAAFRPYGLALSLESWRHPGSLYCFQPCLCVSISCVWDVQDLEGLVDALLATSEAATVYIKGRRPLTRGAIIRNTTRANSENEERRLGLECKKNQKDEENQSPH